jgi:glycosyltransferase involved in cell wall biosynthesis
LIHYGVRRPIEVVANFIPDEELDWIPKREAFNRPPARAVVVSRLVGLKRLDVIIDAVCRNKELADFPIDIIGDGPEREMLRQRAAECPNVRFLGFDGDAIEKYASYDLLIHGCPTEAFGLVILEAMAARLPVLVPDQGGTALLVDEGRTGFKFKANDPDDLARRLIELRKIDPAKLNEITANAAQDLYTRFSEKGSLEKYRRLFAPH